MKILILVFLTLISSCNDSLNQQKSESNTVSKLDFVVLKYQPKWHWTFKNGKPSNLAQSELNELDEIIKITINEHNKLQEKELIEYNKNKPEHKKAETGYELSLENFKRQYVPITNEKGEKEVFVNLFCNNFAAENWKTVLVQVEDGGNCFCNMKINLTRQKYYELEVNYSL